ncbi:hypothetical protein J2X45_001263 [Caulobacter sp. BE264]|uniref:hypothetical protein n=1 Tax=Caulobacter sp. BE264 TaxID=2817724 RepID=UPI002864AA15|nr:hypothetical protein [Caulobacter sp. BE264]MDR7230182.1 hypothetical protein [Caulobacter sp. BE264]
MKLASLAAVITLGLSTSACVIIDADDVQHEPITPPASSQSLEPLMAARVDGADLVVRVTSNGCTRQEDFSVETQRRDGLTSFSFVRKRPDNCRALIAEGVELRYPLDAFGVERGGKIRLRNPLVRP